MAQLRLKFTGNLTEFMGEFLDDLADYPDFEFKSSFRYRDGALWVRLDEADTPKILAELEDLRKDPEATDDEVLLAGKVIRGIKAAAKEASYHDEDVPDDSDYEEVKNTPDHDDTQDLSVDKLFKANTWPVPGEPAAPKQEEEKADA